MGIERDTGEWSFDTDVVVVGSGGCGLAAAIAAAQSGADVLVLEKLDRPYSNTARSGGMIPASGTRFQREAGIEETAQDLAQDILHKNNNTSDEKMTLYMAQVAETMVEWLVDDAGVDLVFIDDFKYPGHSQYRMHAPPSRTGAALVDDLRRAVENMDNAEIIHDAAAEGLVADGDTVTGVVVRHGQNVERVQAKKIILACNGFAGNPEMIGRHCPEIAGALYFGGEGNTGEGILWGEALGAQLAFMDAFQSHASVATPHGILITYAIIMEGGFQVNAEARRFGDESSGYSEHALAVLAQPEGVAWDIYDERLHRLARKFEDYQESEEAGAIVSAATLPELANAIGVSGEQLLQTLDAYHAAADGVQTDEFGRRSCVHLQPPFYAVKVTGALFHTQGGLTVDRHARVLGEDGNPIDNLYAGGGVAAGLSGHGAGGYLSGNGLLTALGYGMLAGQHAGEAVRQGR